MALRRKFQLALTALCALTFIVGFAAPQSTAWARALTPTERDILDEYRKKKQERAEKAKGWSAEKANAKEAMFWALDKAIGKVFEPLEVVPASGKIIDKIKPTSRGIYRYFVEEPWMRDMYNKYTDTLRGVKTAAFEEDRKTRAELDRVSALLDKLGDDDSKDKQLLEDERRRLNQEIDATDKLFHDLDLRLKAAERAKDEFDRGGDIPEGFPKLLQNLNNEIKEMQDRRKRQAGEPEEEIDTSCKDLREQQIEIEQKLYAEFQRRRNDPGMVLEAQRAQNEKLKLEAQMAHCAD